VALVGTDGLKENVASIMRVNAVPCSLMMRATLSSEMSGLARATRRNIPKYGILHNHRGENLKSYITLTGWAL
jgi:hypothetical protein